MAEVKSGNRRAEKARETRRRMLEAARELFTEQGYGATTLQDVAGRAGVAVQTIYFTFGNKRTLLKEVVDVVVAGDDEPVPTMERPWFLDALAEPTAEGHLRAHVAGATAVLGRMAEIDEQVRVACATDPEVAALWPTDPDPRLAVQQAAAEVLVGKPGIRPGVTAARAGDLLYGLLSTELYLVLVRDRGWTPKSWERWVFETLRAQLCGGDG
ncbi:TetR/AcrR family transcriptional regulator [Kitasatospora sp. NPDC048365]|uniref:TetR/AcrR family transcriptional regulator n=1 Tax=Kitasatospora sp. NPDC048365 TaxID=3364050 RepID=UPI0037115540